ncbi:MAG TPA: division/cell wall cluster transcriptional repressor MraZ [Gaiellaceae bacterium]
MLVGEYDHTIDDKNRLTLPAKFRQAFSEGLVLSRGIERCLYAYPRSEWEATVQSRLGELDLFSKEGRVMQRYFFAGAAEAEVDKQGRVMVPSSLGSYAGLGKEVVVAGIHDHLEIWDRAAWRAHLDEIEGSAEDVAERLATKRD